MANWLEDVLLGALGHGVNHPTLVLLNVTLLFTLLSLLCLLVCSIFSYPDLVPHVSFLLFLATGLCASINWFVCHIGLVDAAKQQAELLQSEDAAPTEPGTGSDQPAATGAGGQEKHEGGGKKQQ